MKKIALFCVSAAALFGAQAAYATTYTPAGTFHATGTLTVQKGLTLTCAADFTVVVPNAAPDSHGSASHGHSATVTAATLTGSLGLCSAVTLNNFPWAVNLVGSNLTFSNVAATTITPGNCLPGTVQGAWNNTARTVSFVNQTLTGGSGSANCVINGTLTVNPTISITNP